MNKLEGLSIESQEYEEIVEELKKSVCNKVIVVVVVVVASLAFITSLSCVQLGGAWLLLLHHRTQRDNCASKK